MSKNILSLTFWTRHSCSRCNQVGFAIVSVFSILLFSRFSCLSPVPASVPVSAGAPVPDGVLVPDAFTSGSPMAKAAPVPAGAPVPAVSTAGL